MKKNVFYSVLVAAVSLIAAAVCHRFYPGLGPVLKPLLWPTVILPFLVRPSAAVPTVAILPFISAAVNGMPQWHTAVALSAVSTAVTFSLCLAVAFLKRCLLPDAAKSRG
jgi:hypothetical protein